MTSGSLDRRTLLLGLCGITAAGLGTALLADGAQAATGIKVLANGQAALTVKQIAGLAKVGGSVNLGTVKGVPTVVVRTGASTYAALDLRCTHQGVTVQSANGAWACPAHGSRFAANGAVTGGPAMRNLNSVKSTFKNGVLTVG
ncbi:MAG: Rieske 2Fe-2S domain-containing protein [Actinomycetota bacterium]|nr:Rieske 2Fe-2S domain-containing protein [Actinomycetota bacterium]MDP2288510.1 Rieske 2Fe-2S domain-containing protein [Actinomycetota bacterium]